MPYIVTTSYYPSDKVDEVVKVYLELLKKYPPDENIGQQVAHGTTRTKKGLKAIAFTEIKKGKLDEAIERTTKQMAMFYSVVGFESRTEIFTTIEEGFVALGLEPPV